MRAHRQSEMVCPDHNARLGLTADISWQLNNLSVVKCQEMVERGDPGCELCPQLPDCQLICR